MGILSNTKVYLCGQVEFDNEAADWRKELASRLFSIDKSITVWDPLIKPLWVSPDVRNDEIALKWKNEIFGPDFNTKGRRCFEANIEVRRLCKQLANKCDWMIARVNSKFTWGSIDELEIAIERKIPIFLVNPDNRISTYGLPGLCDFEFIDHYVYEDMDMLLSILAGINKGAIPLPKEDPERWLYCTWVNSTEDCHVKS
jgi:hypothetical protein